LAHAGARRGSERATRDDGRLAEEWAAVGENGLRRKEIPFFFSFSNFSKPNFKEFSNPNLNLIKPLISKI
jgi:hypothetical protein